MKRVAVYAGSFDPITSGHLDLVRRATGLFDEVVLAIGNNPAKRYLLPTETRLSVLEACTSDLPTVSVDVFEVSSSTTASPVTPASFFGDFGR